MDDFSLSDEDLRWLNLKPVEVKYTANGKPFVAEARPAREGGFWAVVPSLGGVSTCADTMDELKLMLVDMTELVLDCQSE